MNQGVSGGGMLQYMVNGSRAVLLRPSVSTFEEYERDDLNWATIYVLLGAAIAAILGAVSFAIQRPDLQAQLNDPEIPDFLRGALSQAANQSIVGAVVQNLVSALLSYFIGLGIIYLLGRLFGGSGKFGELAFDVALFQAPLAVFNAVVGVISIGPLAILTGIVLFASFIYSLYLSYLSIQSGMNLPANKALYVILTIIGVVVLLVCAFVAFAAVIVAALSGGAR